MDEMSVARSPLISIPLCTYNGEKYLAAQLDSLIAQTYTNIEILAFDDASIDSSVEILQFYAKSDNRIKIAINENNLGFSGNFQRALSACTGDYIAPCDQDDIWLPNKLIRLLEFIGGKSLAYCDSLIVGEQAEPLECKMSDLVVMQDMNDPMGFVFDNCVSGHALLFKRDLLSAVLPVPDSFFYDHWIAAVAAAHNAIAFCPEVLVLYRQHGDNITNVLKARKYKQQDRSPGSRLKAWRKAGDHLRAISGLPGSHSSICAELAELWAHRETEWISVRLCWVLLKNEKRLYVIYPRSKWAMIRDLKRRLVGIKLKRLFSPFSYKETDS